MDISSLCPLRSARAMNGCGSQVLRGLQYFRAIFFAHMGTAHAIEDVRDCCARDASSAGNIGAS